MLIILTSLVSTNKIQKNFFSKVMLEPMTFAMPVQCSSNNWATKLRSHSVVRRSICLAWIFRRLQSTACKRTQHCWSTMLGVCKPCYMLLGVVARSLKLVKLLSQQLSRGVAQQCWIRSHSLRSQTYFRLSLLSARKVREATTGNTSPSAGYRSHGSSNIVGVTHAHYIWSPWR